ncbi:SDR family oxidoreductase [Geomonas sp. RF6]|uniref:SDR family oxidoreductase n=1 Tax=Geomonas sp. RF6 TaxID=2897342 RepID=UPI001E39C423|nr:SDR family oxidoreductase [Geomonas sp. RF6]UFS72131.1 SDR family oxidoreductase [Geomonas sp. RF6]
MKRKEGKKETVVVTGASAGVGRAVACAFGRTGARVALLARDRERLESVRREVEAAGGEGLVVVTDVADPGQVERAAQETEEAFGPIDIWVNNAMTSVFSPFTEMTPEEFRRVTEVTYLGTVYGTWSALKRMMPRDRGVIVQVGSALADRSIPLQSAYCGGKHAIRGFTDSLRCELLHSCSGVHLTMVQLPAMNTPQFAWVKSRLPFKAQPVPPIYQPEVAARAIVWAAHHRRRELWVGVPTVESFLGNRLFPGLLDRYLARKGYAAQQTDEPEVPDRPNNLWETVPGPFGARGTFDERAQEGSPEVWMAEHKWQLALAAAGSAGLLLSLARCRRKKRRRFRIFR